MSILDHYTVVGGVPVPNAAHARELKRRERKNLLLKAIIDQKPPPCDGCGYRQQCEAQELVCSVFRSYAGNSSGRKKKPVQKVPDMTYQEWLVDCCEKERRRC